MMFGVGDLLYGGYAQMKHGRTIQDPEFGMVKHQAQSL